MKVFFKKNFLEQNLKTKNLKNLLILSSKCRDRDYHIIDTMKNASLTQNFKAGYMI